MGRTRDNTGSWNDLRVLVVGLARSGQAAARLLATRGARVLACDRQPSIPELPELGAGVDVRLGAEGLELLDGMDAVVLSPGVSLTAALPREAVRRGVRLLGELELAWQLAGVPVLAVTGTNGKSTTTALCAHLLRAGARSVFLGGNIGRPFCEMLLDDAPLPDWAAIEVSSFQLEHLSAAGAVVPAIALWLNLTPDHLDRHGELATYTATKRRLFAGQGSCQTGVFNLDDPIVAGQASGLACRRLGFGRRLPILDEGSVHIADRMLTQVGGGERFEVRNPRLLGDHNIENAAAAVAAALVAGVGAAQIQQGLDDFAGLAHRIEPVRELDGVQYINDSKGTNPDATAKSLTAFERPVVLIAGGRGKGTGYAALRQPVRERVRHLVLFGEDASRLEADLAGCAPIARAGDLAEAVALAQRLASRGDVVLLSPACASFDMFRDFEHRGQVFGELVRALEVRP